MFRRFLPVLVATSLLVLGSSPAAALILDANVLGIYSDAYLTEPVAGVTIDPSGDVATAPLAAGQFVLIGVDVSNPEADVITAIFVSLVHQGDELSHLGVSLPPTMLQGPGPSDLSLENVNSGTLKGGGPNHDNGTPGDVWTTAVGYALQEGASGTGPDTIGLLFIVNPAAAERDFVLFDMGFTHGDTIAGASSITFSDAVIHVIPEPGTGLLIGIGLATLARYGRRRRAG